MMFSLSLYLYHNVLSVYLYHDDLSLYLYHNVLSTCIMMFSLSVSWCSLYLYHNFLSICIIISYLCLYHSPGWFSPHPYYIYWYSVYHNRESFSAWDISALILLLLTFPYTLPCLAFSLLNGQHTVLQRWPFSLIKGTVQCVAEQAFFTRLQAPTVYIVYTIQYTVK